MQLLKSCMIAVSMYSKIPVPQFEWEEKNMRGALAFFPVVGFFVGLTQLLGYWFARACSLSVGFYGALATVLPLVVTGGIHADGFCDTMDARASWQPVEKRLAILKDSHTGAFAVIWSVAYFLLTYGAWQNIDGFRAVCIVAVCYVISRALSGLAAVTFPAAKKTGTLAAFTNPVNRRAVMSALLLFFAAGMGVVFWLSVHVFCVLFLCGGFFFIYYYRMAKREFGGITGDLAGWFLQCFELLVLVIVACVQP